MLARLRPILLYLPLAGMLACSVTDPAPPADTTAPLLTTNFANFDPPNFVPLPNILATATAPDPLTGRAANKPMTPPEALAYINFHEVGNTNAVAGVNAPIYLTFAYPLEPSTVNAANIKVFLLTADPGGATENNPLGFTDISGLFSYQYAAGSTDVWLMPNFPLAPGTRYLYVVTNRVLDAHTGLPINDTATFDYLKSTTSLANYPSPINQLEAIRANVMSGQAILLSGYAKVMNDLITAKATTTIASRADIAVLGRFITTGAGFIPPDPVGTPGLEIPMESALRAFAAGAALESVGGLPGGTWNEVPTVAAAFTAGNANPQLTPAAFWTAYTGSTATLPPNLGAVVLGAISSGNLSIDPVVARASANAGTIDLTGVTGAYNPAAGVTQAFRNAGGQLLGFYNSATPVPFLYLAPASTAPAGGFPLVIFQHGIGGYKEEVLQVAQALTSAGFAVISIDLPLHGALAGYDLSKSGLPTPTLQATWTSNFMALGAPLATRTNVQQAAFNLDRLEFTVATQGFAAGLTTFNGSLAAYLPARTGMQFVGISLGSIVGAYYLAGNATLNPAAPAPYTQATLNNDMKGYLSVPGARLAYLLQNSPSFSGTINAGLAAEGLAKGSVAYNEFFQVTQSVTDPIDPATMTTPLGLGLPSRLSGRIAVQESTSTTFAADGTPTNGDLTITNPYTRYFGNALGGEGVLPTGDIAPGFFQIGYLGGATPTVPAPFMFTLNGGVPAPKIEFGGMLPVPATPNDGYFQFNQAGIEHGSLLDPSAANIKNLQWIQEQMVYFLGADGHHVVIDPTYVVPN